MAARVAHRRDEPRLHVLHLRGRGHERHEHFLQQRLRFGLADAGLEADLCEVVAIGFMQAEYSTGAAVYTRADMSESALLTWLWEAVTMPSDRSILGFNTLSFDLPVLIRRSQLLGIAYPDLNLDRYRTPHVDLLQKLTFNGALAMRSLNFYAKRFGIPCHDMTTGKDIAALVAANDWATVTAHCRDDVEVTGALARRLGFLPQLAAESAVA